MDKWILKQIQCNITSTWEVTFVITCCCCPHKFKGQPWSSSSFFNRPVVYNSWVSQFLLETGRRSRKLLVFSFADCASIASRRRFRWEAPPVYHCPFITPQERRVTATHSKKVVNSLAWFSATLYLSAVINPTYLSDTPPSYAVTK